MFLDSDNGYLQIIIYAIAMVGGLIANAYRNYNKRKAKQNQPIPHDEDESHFPQDIFEPVEEESTESAFPEFIFEEQEPEPEPEMIEEELEVELASTVQEATAMSTEGQSLFQETAQRILEEDQPLDEQNTMDEEMQAAFRISSSDTDKEDTGFDLEKAVIYAEILKPKYFNNSY